MQDNLSLVTTLLNKMVRIQPVNGLEDPEPYIQTQFLAILSRIHRYDLHSHFRRSFQDSQMDALLSFKGGIFKFR